VILSTAQSPPPLHDVTLDYRSPAGERRGEVQAPGAGGPAALELPRVSIGEPQCWDVADVYRTEQVALPPALASQLDRNAFVVLRLACTLRPGDGARVDHARLTVVLRGADETAAEQPIAFDLHPMELYDESRRDVKVKLSPSLKFAGAEVSVGEVAVELAYDVIVPRITAGGSLESVFDWDMRRTDTYPLQGIRWFHAVLKVPHAARPVTADVEVSVDVATQRGLFRGTLREQDRRLLSRVICP
jgi:hypothetical protein